MATEKRWGIVAQWYRGEVSDSEFFDCFWGDMKKSAEEREFPTWQETIARKPLEMFSLEELQAELKFLKWGDEEFGYGDDGVVRMEKIQRMIWQKMADEELLKMQN